MDKTEIANELYRLLDMVDRMKDTLSELVAHVDADISATNHDLGLFQTETPEGYETILGFMDKYLKHELDLLEDPVQNTVTDGFKLTRACREAGVPVVSVDAPEICQRAGVTSVNAYPLNFLIKHFGQA